jgi:hypothetical protein
MTGHEWPRWHANRGLLRSQDVQQPERGGVDDKQCPCNGGQSAREEIVPKLVRKDRELGLSAAAWSADRVCDDVESHCPLEP